VDEQRFSICQFTTLPASFEEDVAAYRAAGTQGIGICEMKLVPEKEQEQRTAVKEAGLGVTTCIPAVPSILPLPLLPGPEDPEERIEDVCAGIRRLAPFEPTAIVCLTGPAGPLDESEARRVVGEGLRAIAAEGGRQGVPIALEPMQSRFRDDWTLITTMTEALELLDEAEVDGAGILFDTWHLWNAPALADEIAVHGKRILGVHVNDWREPTRSWCDRVLPGEGAIDLPAILAALDQAGWQGFYELEVFSDDGTFGNDFPDSLWKVDAEGLARRGHEAFGACWEEARRRAA
jgi:sugar phosphate isomerase/epimerase